MMKRILWAPALLSLATTVGCGGSNPTTSTTEPSASHATSQASTLPENTSRPVASNVLTPEEPTEVVRLFLDAMRAGNGEQIAALFSSNARIEIEKQGLKIEPLGTAQATFEVQDAKLQGDAYIVTSKWIEPAAAPGEEAQEMEVLWVLRKEISGWRICEMAVDPGTGDEYEVVNFEKLEMPSSEQTGLPPAEGSARVASLPGANSVPAASGTSLPNSTYADPSAFQLPPANSAPLPGSSGNGAGSGNGAADGNIGNPAFPSLPPPIGAQ